MTATQTTLPLSQLRLDKMNVRNETKAPADLIASIKAIGVKVPLIVRKNGVGHIVTDGGMRLAALQFLQQAGTIKADHPVPVVIDKTADAEARETSLALNVIRSAMHPVDEYRAFVALHKDKSTPLDIAAIALRFGITKLGVEQRLALGALDEKILTAWRDGVLKEQAAAAFTLCPDKKSQVQIFERLKKQRGRIDDWSVKQALKIAHDNPGRMLNIVGEAAYLKRGGKIHRDLFGNNHTVSDAKLLRVMVDAKLEEICKQLVKDGWSFANARPTDSYSYGTINAIKSASKEERARLVALQDKIDAIDDEESPEAVKLEIERDALEQTIERAAFSAEQKKKSGCFVGVDHNGTLKIEFGKVRPQEKRKVEAQERAKTPGVKKAKAVRKGDDHISNALVQRLSEQLTTATKVAIAKEPLVALAAVLAGFASEDKTVSVIEKGLTTKRLPYGRRLPAFASVFAIARKKNRDQLLCDLAQVAGEALDFETNNSTRPPLKKDGVASICNVLKPADLNKAIRAAFDAKDYFKAVARSIIVSATAESMGADHARNVGKMTKAEAAKFAVANIPKTGWLPSQLRTAHYDGPQKMAKAKAKVKAKAKTKSKTKAKAKARKVAAKRKK